jgi:selenium metabolism protein YedF
MAEIDARKLSCPAPVLLAKEKVEASEPEIIQVLVDNDASRQNVLRFLESRAYTVTVEEQGGDFRLTGARSGEFSCETAPEDVEPRPERKIMVMVATDRLGYGDDGLGLKLMENFLKTLTEMGDDLWRLVFVNNGVKLAVAGSPALEVLEGLASQGTHITVCGTCLTHFGLLEEKQIGETTNMLDIVIAMQLADKVINI